ncbi:hypothetical protein M9H77_05071 [Catharanthus roseus]|uniref:Uncharacterized protein n=1 Tax=Catharanthus roseus TaxID=4058 RepID=A0ACC0CFV4_CATRO|nr:hypothetical protein M9H77_05071 [Catharanthus roseus]
MLRRFGRIYGFGEECFPTELVSSHVPFFMVTKSRRLFSTFDDGDVGSSHFFQSSPPKGEASQSNNYTASPGPMPTGPTRGERRRPSDFSPASQKNRKSAQFGYGDNESQGRGRGVVEDSDFLERFKLGFDRTKRVNSDSKESPDQTADTTAEPTPEDADEIFKKMKETGLIPNAVAMLDGLCKDGLVQEAMKLFGLMREKGTIPEVVIYTAVVEGFCKAQKLDDAIRIFRKMQSNGITPNAFSYGILVQALCRGKRLDDAAEFCGEMLEAGHAPNVATFIGLVDCFCREKGLEETESLITTLRQKGFVLDEKAVREYLDKKGPFMPLVWEAIFGKRSSQRSSFFT